MLRQPCIYRTKSSDRTCSLLFCRIHTYIALYLLGEKKNAKCIIGKIAHRNRNVLNGKSPKPRGRTVQQSDKNMRPGQKSRGADRPRGGRVSRIKKTLTRKEKRKQERLSRKNRATAVYNSKNGGVFDLSKDGQSPRGAKKKRQKVNSKELKVTKRHSKKISRAGEGERESGKNGSNSRQSSAIMREDKEIARLEKLLKMKKRKKLPTSFREEGLNCILSKISVLIL